MIGRDYMMQRPLTCVEICAGAGGQALGRLFGEGAGGPVAGRQGGGEVLTRNSVKNIGLEESGTSPVLAGVGHV